MKNSCAQERKMLVWNSSSSESDKLGIKLTCLLLVFREVGNLHLPQHHCDIIIDLLAQAEPFFFWFPRIRPGRCARHRSRSRLVCEIHPRNPVFSSFARICFWLLRECRGGGVRPPSSHRFLNEFQTGSRASGVRPFSRHGGTDTPTINCAWRGGKIRTTCLFRASEDLRFLPSVRLETSREL